MIFFSFFTARFHEKKNEIFIFVIFFSYIREIENLIGFLPISDLIVVWANCEMANSVN